MEAKETASGFGNLGKTALPLIGKVGTVTGGIVSLFAVFEKISGEIVTTVAGFLLLSAVIASGIVVFQQAAKTVDDHTRKEFVYPHQARIVAALVLGCASIFLVLFAWRMTTIALKPAPPDKPGLGNALRQAATPIIPTRASERPKSIVPTNGPTMIPTNVPTQTPSVPPPTNPYTPAPPTRTPTVTPFPVNQMTDMNGLLGLGNNALVEKNYLQAVGIFSRALQVDATNAQAQFGLGQAYFYLNNVNAAFNPLRSALQLNPGLSDAHAFLGFVYDSRDDFVRARAEYEEYLRVAAKDSPYRSLVQQRLGQFNGKPPYPTLAPLVTATSAPRVIVTPTFLAK